MQLRPAPSQARPPGLFARLLCSNFGLAFGRQVRFWRNYLQCQDEESTSELCREKQRSRVSERNPNRNLTAAPPYSAKTPTRSDTKC